MMYRIMITTILITLLSLPALCPVVNSIFIFRVKEINYYDPLINAITFVESLNGKYIYNAKEDAVGWFSIRQCRIDHYNRLMGTNYVLNDFYNYELSREMFLYFAHGKNYEDAAKSWNGSGPMTEIYWNKVKNKLNNDGKTE